MADDDASVVSHVSIGTTDIGRAAASATRCWRRSVAGASCSIRVRLPRQGPSGALGIDAHRRLPGIDRQWHAYRLYRTHQGAVHAFHDAALASGGEDSGAPGPRPHHGDRYYGCFVRGPDGHKVEAVSGWEPGRLREERIGWKWMFRFRKYLFGAARPRKRP